MKVDLLFDKLCGYFLRGIRSIVSLRGLPQGSSCSPAGVSGNVCHLRLAEPLWVTRPAIIACSTILPRVLKVFVQWQAVPLKQVQGHWRPGGFSVEPDSALNMQNQFHLQATSAPADHWWSRHTSEAGKWVLEHFIGLHPGKVLSSGSFSSVPDSPPSFWLSTLLCRPSSQPWPQEKIATNTCVQAPFLIPSPLNLNRGAVACARDFFFKLPSTSYLQISEAYLCRPFL